MACHKEDSLLYVKHLGKPLNFGVFCRKDIHPLDQRDHTLKYIERTKSSLEFAGIMITIIIDP
jgi:hypothetical protein